MTENLPQYYANTLTPIRLEESSLDNVESDLIEATENAIDLLETHYNTDLKNDSISSGQIGYIFALHRLQSQLRKACLHNKDRRLEHKLDALVGKHGNIAKPRLETVIDAARPSPLTSPSFSAILMRALCNTASVQDAAELLQLTVSTTAHARTRNLNGHALGIDEFLAGRAGLLWGILMIWKTHAADERECVNTSVFASVFQAVPSLVDAIVNAGREGAKAFQKPSDHSIGHHNMALLYTWFDTRHSLGFIHGLTGILAVLLDPALPSLCSKITETYPEIGSTINALCELSLTHNGHLPMSLPPLPNKHPTPLVQICHGAPGLLLLLGAAKNNDTFTHEYWNETWNSALQRASDTVWSQGLLSKGGGVCHGVCGNGLALLRAGDVERGLAMVLEARERKYWVGERVGLLEGLAGMVMVWGEALGVVGELRRRLESERLQRTS